MQEVFAREGIAHWLREITDADIPCGPVQSIDQVFADPQVLAREMVWTVPHPTAGEVRLVGSPLKLSETPVTLRSHPPLLGEHTDEVLVDLLGYTSADIVHLRTERVI